MDGMNRLNKYMELNFPELKLAPALFYHSPIGLRFEIGVPYRGIEHPSYFQTVKMRSVFLFEEIFDAADELCMVVNAYEQHLLDYPFLNTGINVIPTFITNKDLLAKVGRVELEREYEEDGKLAGIGYQSCVWCKRNEIDYKGILTAIGYQDFPNFNHPFTREGVYFINPRSHIIYHLYDDRGLDVVSNHAFSISCLYRKYNNWILDYDRQRIDSMFKSF